jgi:hypothetical protein
MTEFESYLKGDKELNNLMENIDKDRFEELFNRLEEAIIRQGFEIEYKSKMYNDPTMGSSMTFDVVDERRGSQEIIVTIDDGVLVEYNGEQHQLDDSAKDNFTKIVDAVLDLIL